MKLNARQLREIEENDIRDAMPSLKRRPIYFILEDVLDTYNIGGLFRLADALAIEKIYLCGGTETPPNHRIKKASVGTYKVVPWEYRSSAAESIAELRETYNVKRTTQGKSRALHATRSTLHVVAIEQHKSSVDYRTINYTFPIAFIVGNETTGVKEETLHLADHIAEIPMWGINKSLNVIVSAAIVSYFVASR